MVAEGRAVASLNQPMHRPASPFPSPLPCPDCPACSPGRGCAQIGAARREWRHQGEVILSMMRLQLLAEREGALLLEDWRGGGDFVCGEALFSMADDVRARIRAGLVRQCHPRSHAR